MARPSIIGSDKRRISVTVSSEMYDILYKEAERLGLSIPSVVVANCAEHLHQKAMMDELPNLMSKVDSLLEAEKKKRK